MRVAAVLHLTLLALLWAGVSAVGVLATVLIVVAEWRGS